MFFVVRRGPERGLNREGYWELGTKLSRIRNHRTILTKKTETLLVEGNQEALNRQLRAFKVQEEKCQNDRILVETKMFQEEKAPEEITEWSHIVEKQLKVADQDMTKIVG